MAEIAESDPTDGASPLAILRERMRQRRPHLFSDTVRTGVPELSREVLDYHLDTLTRRKQEYQFEHFARALAEKVLCPNLRPQTGPTGGGDSKVDTETYPVAPDIAERWLVGETAAGERWAFAFSAKEKWQPKARSDVAGIIGTGRPYSRIFFVTSRYAADKARARLEDELSGEAGIPVTILDRSWILDRVFQDDLLELAIETLGIAAGDRTEVSIGPKDAARSLRLAELDAQIADPGRYREARYSLAEDWFTSALLARGLERPRAEVEARFARALRVAGEVGAGDQTRRILYHEAWTALWWYGDHATLLADYERLEEMAASTSFADDLEQLTTLWQLLSGGCIGGVLDPAAIDLPGKRARLVEWLGVLASDAARPNNALHARFALAILEAHAAIAARDVGALDRVWRSLVPVMAEGENLLSLPLEQLVGTLEAMGEFVPASDAYEELLDSLLPVIERRRSGAAAGRALLRRGLHKLDAGRLEEAVVLLGRADVKLACEEHVEEFVQALMALASAYLALGLPWAARTKLLMAADRSLAMMREEGDIPAPLLRALYELTWVEIRLGRLPQALAAWRHLRLLAGQFEMDGSDRADLDDDFHVLARLIGHMLLACDLDQLAMLSRLPDTLYSLDLDVAAMLLLWGLGHEEIVRGRHVAEEDQGEDLDELFRGDLDHPAVRDLPRRVMIGDRDDLTMSARALGCELRIDLPNEAAAIRVAEAVLGAFQAFLSTSLGQEVMPYRDHVRLELTEAEAGRFEAVWHDQPETWARIGYPRDVLPMGRDDRTGFDEWLRDLIGEIVARSFYIPDPEGWLTEVAGTEQGFSRAITLGNVPVLASSVFGDAPMHRLDFWIDGEAEDHPLVRDRPWVDEEERARLRIAAADAERPPVTGPAVAVPPLPADSHARLRVTSIVDLPLWERAGWSGTGILVWEDEPPALALCFRDIAAGARIFEGWRARFGSEDVGEAIRVAIVRGVSCADPAAYAVTVGRNNEDIQREEPDALLSMLSRINWMDRPDPANLENFLASYRRSGSYRLVPMAMTGAVALDAFRFDLAILKRRLEVRSAWEIGSNDPDMSVLRDGDEPKIPDGLTDPPVREALAILREIRAQRRVDGSGPAWGRTGTAA